MAHSSIGNTKLRFTEPLLEMMTFQEYPIRSPLAQWEPLGISRVNLKTPRGIFTILQSAGPHAYPFYTPPSPDQLPAPYLNDVIEELQTSKLLVAYVFRCAIDPEVRKQFDRLKIEEFQQLKNLLSSSKCTCKHH